MKSGLPSETQIPKIAIPAKDRCKAEIQLTIYGIPPAVPFTIVVVWQEKRLGRKSIVPMSLSICKKNGTVAHIVGKSR
jgi:hypothetical protein